MVFGNGCGVGQEVLDFNGSEDEREHANATTTCVRTISFPLWFPALVFAAWPMAAFIRGPERRRCRRKRGLCLEYGYNLTGLTEPWCPECGTEFHGAE